ncbi:hypothetical protein SEA_TUNATARTARE_201 [Streptomyces phage TunaTartare]|jgi:hypothetical protein|uniref:Uncharacterized protein n=1 Tax=Streptomyces phage TunaTartare TaxID=2848887 RepID=A0A8F2E6T0_9CAUD|nr:hypothetical protein PP457_gp079 [Streptomyces phage TunaTartare]QWT30063.1 hypothetical protein SEA_TUNATARTARE_201 [Streptomyces phage TunaTartare]
MPENVTVDKTFLVTALICCLNAKTMIGLIKDGEEIPAEIVDIGESALDTVLEATPAELRELVIEALMEDVEIEDILEYPAQP